MASRIEWTERTWNPVTGWPPLPTVGDFARQLNLTLSVASRLMSYLYKPLVEGKDVLVHFRAFGGAVTVDSAPENDAFSFRVQG